MMNQENLKNMHTRLALHNAQGIMRAKFSEAIKEFAQNLEKFGADVIADVQINISYTRKKEVK